jgi:hypothetical protein
VTVGKQIGTEEIKLPADNHYVNMWSRFASEVQKGDFSNHWKILLDQSRLLEEIRRLGAGHKMGGKTWRM